MQKYIAKRFKPAPAIGSPPSRTANTLSFYYYLPRQLLYRKANNNAFILSSTRTHEHTQAYAHCVLSHHPVRSFLCQSNWIGHFQSIRDASSALSLPLYVYGSPLIFICVPVPFVLIVPGRLLIKWIQNFSANVAASASRVRQIQILIFLPTMILCNSFTPQRRTISYLCSSFPAAVAVLLCIWPSAELLCHYTVFSSSQHNNH